MLAGELGSLAQTSVRLLRIACLSACAAELDEQFATRDRGEHRLAVPQVEGRAIETRSLFIRERAHRPGAGSLEIADRLVHLGLGYGARREVIGELGEILVSP